MLSDLFDIIRAITGQDPLPSLLLTVLVIVALLQLRSQRAMTKTVHSWDVTFTAHKGITELQFTRLDEHHQRNTDRLNHHHERLNHHERAIQEHSFALNKKGHST